MMLVSNVRPALGLLVIMTVLLGVAYPQAVTLSLHALFPDQAEGSLLKDKDGNVVGSALLGQYFDDPKYFGGRPSATTPMPYNAALSGGANLATTNPDLAKQVEARVKALRDQGEQGKVPVDLVTTSASGLDPNISPAAAQVQVARVARLRGLSEDDVKAQVARFTLPRQFGILGEPRVEVLRLNLALDGKL